MIRAVALAALLAGVIAANPISAQALPPAPSYYIFAVDASFGPRAKIGAKRAGLLCIPAGPLRWRDVDNGGVSHLGAMLGAALNRAGLHALSRDRDVFETGGPDADYRVVVTIKGIDASVCAPHWGLGGKRAYDGHGRIALRWQVYSRATRAIVDDWETQSTFQLDRHNDESFIKTALDGVARDFADHEAKQGRRH
ncbi:hypothetical protein ACLB0R_14915 [Sphingomonas sp. GlSt437]|uniref:hypothetical protein n=1 Tax=Sphingomonas sp. GlSt437 TaxID=3389970 RepID=UPI003A87CCB5